MFITFSMAVMRMSGAIGFNPLFGKSNFPVKIRAYFIFALSLLLYLSADQTQMAYPESMAEYILMLAGELFLGAVLAFAMELAFLTIRLASSIMDYSMGLSMAQVYDPQYGTQSTVSSGIYYAFMVLIFFASNSHLRLLELFYQSVQLIPFGKVTFNPMLVHVITAGFCQGILTGMQFAFPMIAIELVSELAMGILMRIIPQINVFTVNFQVKIIMGLLMMLLLFSPMADYINTIFTYMYQRECNRRWDRVVRRKQNSLPPKRGRMPEKKEISSKAGM